LRDPNLGDSDETARVTKFYSPEHRGSHSKQLSRRLRKETSFNWKQRGETALSIAFGYGAAAMEVLAGLNGMADVLSYQIHEKEPAPFNFGIRI
jgi:hypothetical protein